MTRELVEFDRSRSPAPEASERHHAGTEHTESARLVIRHILVPLDGSATAESTLPFAAAAAEAFSAHLTLLRVLETPSDVAIGTDALDWEMARAEAYARLAQLQTALQAQGHAVEVEIVQGNAAEQIGHIARTHGVNLVVLSSHGVGGMKSWNLGGTVQKVIASTHASVLIVPVHRASTDAVRLQKMLLPLDCSQRAECILPAATELARAHGAHLILAHVVPEPELPRRLPPSTEDLELAERLTERNRTEAQRYLEEIQRRLSATAGTVEIRLVVSPRHTHALRELAKQERVDLVVLSAHGSTGDATQRYGRVAFEFLHQGGEPVIILQDLGEVLRPADNEGTSHHSQEPQGH